ncbi:MAG TPA: hypothetical protein VLY04_22065 [Bryobacteraceae bacterium]|nr:hypothetical protein [Bryobacteraceae bacterium]
MYSRLLLAALAATTLAFAQGGMGGQDTGGMGRGGQDTGRGGDMGGMNGMGGMGMRQKQTKPELISDKLKLSKDQQKEFITILQVGAQDSANVRQLLVQGRSALASAMVEGKSADEINQILKAYTDAEAQMTNFEVKAFQKVYAILKPNQTSKAPQAFELMAGIFDAQSGGGRGAGGGQGRDRGGR